MTYMPPVTSGLVAGGGGAGMAAAATPFSALLWPLLLSFGPAALQKLFGGDPQQKLRDEINRLINPRNLGKVTDEFYRTAVSSPAYSQAQGAIATGANQTANAVASSLAARGIGTTGTGAVLSGLTPSLVGSQVSRLKADAHTQARQETENWLKARIAALTGTQGPSPTQQMFAGGLEAFGPFLQAYLRGKYPGFNVGGTPGTTVTR